MDERLAFVEAYSKGVYTMSELCRSAGVSRPTGYLWVARYRSHGEAGLHDRSHLVRHCPHRTPAPIVERLLELRQEHPFWGPRKLVVVARRRWPHVAWPSRSTVALMLKREGLSAARRPRRRLLARAGTTARTPQRPNGLWTFDFKGQFRTADRRYCYPLTTTDLASRDLLQCVALRSTSAAPVQRHTDALMREVGLPEAIHSDGGTPFAGPGIGHLTQLALHWLKLGIRLERSRPASPQDNASHERMHRTLKQHTARPPAATLAQQQRRFDRFRHEFNHERPHEALGDRTPAEFYRPSSTPFPERLPEVTYPGHYTLRRITHSGSLCWHSRRVFLSIVLARETVGLIEVEDGVWSVYFAQHLLARLDEHVGKIIEVPV
jgi:transposase InsO family protein